MEVKIILVRYRDYCRFKIKKKKEKPLNKICVFSQLYDQIPLRLPLYYFIQFTVTGLKHFYSRIDRNFNAKSASVMFENLLITDQCSLRKYNFVGSAQSFIYHICLKVGYLINIKASIQILNTCS